MLSVLSPQEFVLNALRIIFPLVYKSGNVGTWKPVKSVLLVMFAVLALVFVCMESIKSVRRLLYYLLLLTVV